MALPLLQLNNLHKRYVMGDNIVHALRGVDLTIEAGDFVAIMGPSGSGKSTLMQIMGLLDVPSEGTYSIGEREVSKLSEDELAVLRRGEIGFIFQQFNLLPRLTAQENVALPLLYSENELDLKRAQELLTKVGLGQRGDHKPKELSGGQQQRVAIARSLINRPRIVFADEPTGNLDSVSEKDIMAELHRLNQEGITVVLVTHEEEIGQQALRLIRMRDGEIQSDERLRPLPPNKRFQTHVPASAIVHPWQGILKQHLLQGIRSLLANKVRSFLSMLGILIGVAAVVAMLALGKGAQSSIEERLSGLGSNLLVLRGGASRGAGGAMSESGVTAVMTLEDARAIREKVPHVVQAEPTQSGRGQAVYKNKNWNTSIAGTTPTYATMKKLKPLAGRFFNEEEVSQRKRVAVLGATVVQELFGDKSPIGEMIKINKINFQVIGVLEERGSGGFRNEDDQIAIPVTTAMYRVLGRPYVENIDIEVDAVENISFVEEEVVRFMSVRHKIPPSQEELAFRVHNMKDIQNAMASTTETMTVLLSIIAAISLVVGGIGIMNIMLVSVTERTKEIGLRKALGAKRIDILLQFLIEAVVISGVGGTSGIILAWLITVILSMMAGWATIITTTSVIAVFLFSALTGIIFGLYPAKQASRLPPIEALRYE